jgi:23S rRNA (pseudouridine1915-N3)-methyltransferase
MIAAGTRLPSWVNHAYLEYASRMPKECALILREIPVAKRRKSVTTGQLVEKECRAMLAAIPRNSIVLALDRHGKPWSTQTLSVKLEGWLQSRRELALMIGGPDGLAKDCLGRADHRWSLSALTFPHALVRVMVAEQLFRAWSIVRNHPYHRA